MDNSTLLNSAWAITPEALQKIASIDPARMEDPVANYVSDTAVSYKEREAEFLKQFEEKLSIDRDGCATLDVCGPLMPSPNAVARYYYDAADSVRIASLIRSATENSEVETLVLRINSPGGMVVGTPEMGAALREFNEAGKTSWAFSNVLMASGAYWLGSQAKHVSVTESALIGSIGVIRPHVDSTGLHSNMGVKIEIFRGGKHKVAGAYGTTLTDEQRSHIQEGVDDIHADFKAAVNEYRTISDENMQGQVLYGKDALKAGMVDSITADEVALGGLISGSLVDISSGAIMSNPSDQIEPGASDDSASAELESAKADLATANDRIAELEDSASKVEALEGQVAELEGERDSASERVTELEGELAEANSANETLQADFDAKVASAADEKAAQLAPALAAKIAAQTGTDPNAIGASDSDEDIDSVNSAQYSLMSVEDLYKEHASIIKEKGAEAGRAFYVEHIRSRRS